MRNWPLPSVTTDRTFSMRAGLDASTVTPGRTAPEVSRTTPEIEACANATAGARQSAKNRHPRRSTRFMVAPYAGRSLMRRNGGRSAPGFGEGSRFGAKKYHKSGIRGDLLRGVALKSGAKPGREVATST